MKGQRCTALCLEMIGMTLAHCYIVTRCASTDLLVLRGRRLSECQAHCGRVVALSFICCGVHVRLLMGTCSPTKIYSHIK